MINRWHPLCAIHQMHHYFTTTHQWHKHFFSPNVFVVNSHLAIKLVRIAWEKQISAPLTPQFSWIGTIVVLSTWHSNCQQFCVRFKFATMLDTIQLIVTSFGWPPIGHAWSRPSPFGREVTLNLLALQLFGFLGEFYFYFEILTVDCDYLFTKDWKIIPEFSFLKFKKTFDIRNLIKNGIEIIIQLSNYYCHQILLQYIYCSNRSHFESTLETTKN